jgi:Ase1/PRC1/MAP65 family protein
VSENQQIWTEVGESEGEKNKVLSEIDWECLEVYRRKVEDANRTRVQLHQSVAAKEAEVASLVATLGEHKLYLKVYYTTIHGHDGAPFRLVACRISSQFYPVPLK